MQTTHLSLDAFARSGTNTQGFHLAAYSAGLSLDALVLTLDFVCVFTLLVGQLFNTAVVGVEFVQVANRVVAVPGPATHKFVDDGVQRVAGG